MPRKPTVTSVAVAKPDPKLVKVQKEGLAMASPLGAEVKALKVKTPDDYQTASELLSMVQRARREWAAKMEPILEPLRVAKQAADALKREIDQPLEQYELSIKAQMKAFKTEEARQLFAAEQERQRLQREAEAKAAQAAAAKTKPVQQRLQQQAAALTEQAAEIEEEAKPVKVADSSTRTVRKWRMTSITEVCLGIIHGVIPPEALCPDTVQLNSLGPDEVGRWPGFEAYDDIIITGARRGL